MYFYVFFFGITKKFPWFCYWNDSEYCVVAYTSVSLHPFCFHFFFGFVFDNSLLPFLLDLVNRFVHGHIEFGEIASIDVCVCLCMWTNVFSFHGLKANKILPKCFVRQINLGSLCGYIWHSFLSIRSGYVCTPFFSLFLFNWFDWNNNTVCPELKTMCFFYFSQKKSVCEPHRQKMMHLL